MRLALYARDSRSAVRNIIHKIRQLLPSAAYSIHQSAHDAAPDLESFTTSSDLIEWEPDLLLSIGGDGTLLDTVQLLVQHPVPVMGINLGKLGFLAAVSPDELSQMADAIAHRKYLIHHRMMLRVMNGIPHLDPPLALNDVVVKDARPNALIAVKITVDNDTLGIYHGDGVIVSTPTGSTAYSLSCGGSILYPQMSVIQITPIAAHNLTLRPVILPSSVDIRVEVISRSGQYTLNLDNRQTTLPSGHPIRIRPSQKMFPLAVPASWNYLATLREKLHWASELRGFDALPSVTL